MNHFTKVVAALVIWCGDRLLLLQRAKNYQELTIGKGFWDLPGGKLNFGESLQAALQRELTEETGTLVLNSSLVLQEVLSYKIQDHFHITHRIDLIHSMELQVEPEIKPGDEHMQWQFVGRDTDITDLDMIPQIRQFVDLQLKNRSNKARQI